MSRIQFLRASAAAAIGLFGLLILDTAVGLFERKLSDPNGRRAVEILRSPQRAFNGWRFRPRAGMLYINAPGFTNEFGKQIDADGHRAESEHTATPERGVTRILALGGSTTYGEKLNKPAQAWPAQLETLLNKNSARRYEVINAGTPGATTAQLLSHYLFRDRYLKPRLVLIHEAGNDVGPMLLPNYQPDYSHYRSGWFDVLAPRPGEKLLLQSAIARVAYSYWLKGTNLEGMLQQPPLLNGRTPEEAHTLVQKNPTTGYRRNLETLIDLVRQEGAEPVLVEYLIASPKVFDLMSPRPLLAKYYAAVELGVQRLNSEMASIARSKKVRLIKIPRDSVPPEYYFDHCHLREKGELIKAKLVAKALRPAHPL